MKKIYMLLISFLLISCAPTTNYIWGKSTYKEKIGSFLVSKDGKNLVIVGEKYHYIFNLDNKLKNILISEKRKLLKPSFSYFTVDNENNIFGKYTLYYSNKDNNHQKWFKKNGFKSYTKKNKKQYKYSFSGHVKGKRYSTNKKINSSFNFNKTYSLEIEEPTSTLGYLGKLLATPITIAADGVLSVTGVKLFTAFMIPLAIVTGGPKS